MGGLIPACAGKTDVFSILHLGLPAHPRVCGENGKRWELSRLFGGSSPRVRGKHKRIRLQSRACRLIPACAGKTAFFSFL